MTYLASANLLALSSKFRDKLGTMSTVLAGYITLWCNFDFLPALVSYPVGISNTLCDSSSVGINSSPVFSTVDVAPKLTTADVPIFIFSVILFVCFYFFLVLNPFFFCFSPFCTTFFSFFIE